MNEKSFNRKEIIFKIKQIDPKNWWGDEFDVRFFLISKIKQIKNQYVLDLGGGIGIISSQMEITNFIVNLDLSFNDLKTCKRNFPAINPICGSMTNLPFKENVFENVVCAHLLEVGKSIDLSKSNDNSESKLELPTVHNILSETHRIMINGGRLFLTTPNNARYQSTKLSYVELKNVLNQYFSKFSIFFYNTFPRLSKKNRKLNLANVLPKLLSRIYAEKKIQELLLKNDTGDEKNSVSFYVEAEK